MIKAPRLPRRHLFVVAIFVASSCSAPAALTDGPRAGTPELKPSQSNASGTASPSQLDRPAPSAPRLTLSQPWATATLVDVRTGASFRVADLVASGRVVFVEPMAVWCSKCRAQQERAVAAFAQLDGARAVWVGLDVEFAERAQQLAAYSVALGFDFSYAIAGVELSRALAADFGDVVLNPPATNVIVIGVDGGVSHTTGGLSADEIVELVSTLGP